MDSFMDDNQEASKYWDDLTGKQLDGKLVKKAREEEMR